jgi:hypothetical protein
LPDFEGCNTQSAVAGCWHQVTSWAEVSIDERMRRQESLCLPWRLETLHLPFSTPGRSMRVLGPIVQIVALPMFNIRQKLAMSG